MFGVTRAAQASCYLDRAQCQQGDRSTTSSRSLRVTMAWAILSFKRLKEVKNNSTLKMH